MWPPLVRERRSSQVDLTRVVDSVMGPSREDSPTHGLGDEGGRSLEEYQLLYYLPVLLPHTPFIDASKSVWTAYS